jgi:aspartate/methionine/tyrosine aminotransferase
MVPQTANACFLFSDEMYRGLEFKESARLASGVDQYAKAITLCGMSKVYALPGLRIGW